MKCVEFQSENIQPAKMSELRLLSSLSKDVEIKQLSGFPRLKPAYTLTVFCPPLEVLRDQS